MKKINKNLTSFADHLDSEYGKRGTETRDKYEEGFDTFKLGVMLQELRKEYGMTQEQLAENVAQQRHIFPELRMMPATFGFRHL